MVIQGATLQGCKLTGNSLRNVAEGLVFWQQPKTGTHFFTGNRVAYEEDLSGNSPARPFTAYNPATAAAATSAMALQQSTNNAGQGLALGGGNEAQACLADLAFKPILYSGAPMMFFVVFRVNTVPTNSGFRFLNALSSGIGQMEIGCPSSFGLGIRTYNASGNIATNDIAAGTFAPGGYILTVVDYGYNAASADKHRKVYLNQVLKSEVKFSAAPSAATDSKPIFVQSGGLNAAGATNNWVMDRALFDNAGKTAAQVNAEITAVHAYFNAEYPNLYT